MIEGSKNNNIAHQLQPHATSNHVLWEEHGTYPLNSMGHKLLDVEACRSHDRGESSWNKPK